MNKRLFILNADDFGLSEYHNKAVFEGYINGYLTSASLCANGEAFYDAVNNIIPKCNNLSIAVHLNIMEGISLTNCPLLTNKNNFFKNNYLYLILNQNNKALKKQIQSEFKAQIERVLHYTNITHLDSHVHTHAIPQIFEICCELANEYKIKFIRTQFEKNYLIPDIKKHINIFYPLNLIKLNLLRYFTTKNKETIKKFGLKTNDFFIGIRYTGNMNSDAIKYALMKIKDKNCIIEGIIHPCLYEDDIYNSHTQEFKITQDINLKEQINKLGFKLTNFNKI